MRINIIINGRFHFFDLARELVKSSLEVRLYTSLPKWYSVKWIGDERLQIYTVIYTEILKRILIKFGWYGIKWEILLKKWYAFSISRLVSKSYDVTIVFAGNAWYSSTVFNKQSEKQLIVADEGSAHPKTVNNLINRELGVLEGFKRTEARKLLDEETHKQYKLSDIIVVPSTFVKRSLMEHGITEEKIYINPYGVDENIFYPAGYSSNYRTKIRVMSCGLFSIQKGSHYFLEAAEYFSGFDDIEFFHVGAVQKELSHKIARYKFSNFTHFGPVQQNELPRYYRDADIFVLPSVQDGFGMVVLQAMACGLAVICSENSCGRDVINHGENGFVYEPRNLQALTSFIQELRTNKEKLQRFKVNARTTILERFTWVKYGERYVDIIKNAQIRLSNTRPAEHLDDIQKSI